MDVAQILKDCSGLLIEEDLLLLEEELQAGSYDDAYVRSCSDAIASIRTGFSEGSSGGVIGGANRISDRGAPEDGGSRVASRPIVLVDSTELSPYGTPDGARSGLEIDPFLELESIRRCSTYKSQLKSYIEQHDFFDENFVDENFSRFDDLELKIIVASVCLSESFLDKYFDALDPEAVARHQVFSEEFFMRHFRELDAKIVLRQGVNDWRAKKDRSKKLDAFLRLKGVMF